MGLFEKLLTQDSEWRNNKFGRDRFDGGSSKEPFVNKLTLPKASEDNPNVGLLGGNTDFLLRAGTLQRSAEDVSRISQLLLTTGKGASFIAKQNLLSRTNVKTQAKGLGLNQGSYLPTSTIAQVATSGLGFHLNKQGDNPFAATGIAAGEDGTGSTLIGGLADLTSVPTYLSANVKGGDFGDSNRLVQLRNFKLGNSDAILGIPELSRPSRLVSNIAGGIDSLLGTNLKNKVNDLIPNLSPQLAANSISSAKDQILTYGGGPGSEIGVGRTSIRRFYYSDNYDTPEFRKKYYLLDNGFILGLSDQVVDQKGKIRRDFRKYLLDQQEKGEVKSILSDSIDYERDNIENRVGLGSPGKNNKDVTSYTKGLGTPLDKVNSLPLYQSEGVTASTDKNDLVKFRFAIYNPHDDSGKKTYIHFRAFLESFSDNYGSEWNAFKYMGRSENFYKYQGFTREVSIGWKIAAQSREELIPMYKKLNFLQSTLAGDYTPEYGYMEGNIMNLTVGGYLWEQPGFLTSLNVTLPDKSPFEIGIPDNVVAAERNQGQDIDTSLSVRELPLYMDVSANFTPIHNFVPRKQQNRFDDGGGLLTYGQERFVSLSSDAGKTSYEDASNDYFTALGTSRPSIKPSKAQPFETQGPQAEQVDLRTALGISRG